MSVLSCDKGLMFICDDCSCFADDSNRHLAVPEEIAQKALKLLQEHDEITFLASVRQDLGDSGSILSFSSDLYR